MNEDIRQLITEIKAAVRIGHAQSLQIALDGITTLPQIAGNGPLPADFINQALLPVGRVLANPRLPSDELHHLANSSFAAMRALYGAAMVHRYFDGDEHVAKAMRNMAADSRQDVRLAIQATLREASTDNTKKLAGLVEYWLNDSSPRVRETALALLPNLAESALALISRLSPPDEPALKAELSKALAALAQQGKAREVHAVLEKWAVMGAPYAWVICKTLSYAWAAEKPDNSLYVIEMLAGRTGPEKQVKNALEALSRHGADQAVQQALLKWQESDNEKLQAISHALLDK